MKAQDEIEESNQQFTEMSAWYARRAPAGEIADLPGLKVASSRSRISLLNALFLTSPVADAADLARRVETAVGYGDESGAPWMLILCDAWLQSITAEETDRILAGAGLKLQIRTTGMVTDALAAPLRPAPALEIRPIDDARGRIAASDLNCAAYAMPLAWGHESFAREAIFNGGAFGFVGYVDGDPASTATTMIIDDRIYVALVATAEAHRKQGYAEAVMRRALDAAARASGLSRTVLHASEAGFPLYKTMGYRAVTGFTGVGRPPAST